MYFLLASAFVLLIAMRRALAFLKDDQEFASALPRQITPIFPLSVIGAFLPKSRFYRVLGHHWDERKFLYKNAPLKTFVMRPVLNRKPHIYTSSLPAFIQTQALTGAFHKPARVNVALGIFGDNVVFAEGEVWKRHRRVTAPAFGPETIRNVWETTARVYTELLETEGWGGNAMKTATPAVNINTITHKFALFLISTVGFGLPMSWSEPERDARGELSTQATILGVASYIIERAAFPRWFYCLGTEKLKRIEEAYTRFGLLLHGMIDDRTKQLEKLRGISVDKDEFAESIRDVLGRLVNARAVEGKSSLSEQEIIGNCFIFTFAGHETTANTLAATFALLALYQDEQEWVYQSIKGILGDREPTYDDFENLDPVLACFYEALRMFPAAYLLNRQALRDTFLEIPQRGNESVIERIPVKKGQHVILDLVGLGYDPDIFPNPDMYRPQRWRRAVRQDDPDHTRAVDMDADTSMYANTSTTDNSTTTFESFYGFAFGPRACLGAKFARVEAVAFLTLFLRMWRIEPVFSSVEEQLQGDAKKEAWRERTLSPRFGQALLLDEVPVRLVKRES